MRFDYLWWYNKQHEQQIIGKVEFGIADPILVNWKLCSYKVWYLSIFKVDWGLQHVMLDRIELLTVTYGGNSLNIGQRRCKILGWRYYITRNICGSVWHAKDLGTCDSRLFASKGALTDNIIPAYLVVPCRYTEMALNCKPSLLLTIRIFKDIVNHSVMLI